MHGFFIQIKCNSTFLLRLLLLNEIRINKMLVIELSMLNIIIIN